MRDLLQAHGGVIHRQDLLRHVGSATVQRAVARGDLLRVHPGVLALPEAADDRWARMQAALLYAGPGAVLSHLSALAVWGLADLVPPSEPVHLLVPVDRRLRDTSLRVHRRSAEVATVVRRGMPISRIEHALADSWGLLDASTLAGHRLARALVIEAVGRRMITADRVLAAAGVLMQTRGRHGLVRLASLLKAGCRSELELWGFERVFTGPGMPELRRQVQVGIGGRSVCLDLFEPVSRTDVELDGAEWHSAPAARERDLRRDAALAGLGIQVVRFSGSRLFREPLVVRGEFLRVVSAGSSQQRSGQ
ncbi:very-short-patch-repair endonuclease [Allocatelliglobosispora scoriae]|uniref:Very-short-patch-repair endonuclease n=1 Tax=Allocatelliglobosispora scoriae TaxID=643052 RepID=A0A841BUG6_9ACTN|nr:DUF559 domain-containing protein [Allocatelliglobosispora scoriae]MBB5870382.1 very-short-patch-repair endonuclease [Allocatelliglobosispora scoriae]